MNPNLKAGPGRPKGLKNKINQTIREQILASLDNRGGIKYLDGLDDSEFIKLVSRVVPQEIEAKHEGNIIVKIITSGDGKNG